MGKQDLVNPKRGRGKAGRTGKGRHATDTRTGFDGSTHPVLRRNISMFDQPVTVVTTSRGSKVFDAKHIKNLPTKKNDARPTQAMWYKRLNGLSAFCPAVPHDKIPDLDKLEYIEESLQAIPGVQSAADIITDKDASLTVIQVLNTPHNNGTFGQISNKDMLDADFVAFSKQDQPMMTRMNLECIEEKISDQEQRVLDSRKRLQEVMKFFG